MLRVINSEMQPRSGRDRGQAAPADQEKWRESVDTAGGSGVSEEGFQVPFSSPSVSSEISPGRGTTYCSSIKREESPTHGNRDHPACTISLQ